MSIGTLAERSLHASLKAWIARPGDQIEVKVDGFFIDIVRDDTLIEIQTGNFSALKRKLARLLDQHRVHLIHPIPQEKWIVRQSASGDDIGRRKSPKRGQPADLFQQLVYIPHLLSHPNLSLEVLLTRQEELWRDDGQGSWRRKRWSRADQRLLTVLEQHTFSTLADYAAILPPALPQSFTNKDLAATLPCRGALAQKITYTLRQLKLIEPVGKQGRSTLYQVRPEV